MRRYSILLAVALAPAAGAGCGKKSSSGDNNNSPSGDNAMARGPGGGVVVGDPLGGGSSGGGGGGGSRPQPQPQPSPPPSGSGNTNYVPGGGAVQNVRQAARRTVAINDFHQLGIAIQQEMTLDPDQRMPDAQQIRAAVKGFPNLPQAIEEETIILTGTRDRGGLWAYEVEADVKGGIVLQGGTARRAQADEARQLVAQYAPKTAPPQGPKINPPPPAKATVSRQDLEEVRTFIDTFSGSKGRMPTIPEVKGAIAQYASPSTVAHVQKGTIWVTGATTRESVWAYDVDALQRGGLAVTQDGVVTLTAQDLTARLKAQLK